MVCGGVGRGAWRCTEGCAELHGGVRRGVHGGAWRHVEGCAEVCGGLHGGAQRCAKVCRGAQRGAQRWLPLATIHLVGDNREFEV